MAEKVEISQQLTQIVLEVKGCKALQFTTSVKSVKREEQTEYQRRSGQIHSQPHTLGDGQKKGMKKRRKTKGEKEQKIKKTCKRG